MQTFLPYPDFKKSIKCLDSRRLGHQRIDALQIIKLLEFISNDDITVNKNGKVRVRPWINHPVVQMWIGYNDALKLYYNLVLDEWIAREYKNNMLFLDFNASNIEMPWWFDNNLVHLSHQSNLLRKAYSDHYKRKLKNLKNQYQLLNWYKQFNWDVPLDMPYYWPVRNK